MPRAGLTPARVVEEAERLVDDAGFAGLTLAGLAMRLGVRQPSLYKHLDSLDGLRASIGTRAKHELGEVLAHSALGKCRATAITSMSDAYREWAKAHPGRYAATQRPARPEDPEEIRADRAVVRVVAAVLGGYGLGDDDAIDATRALRAALHGFVTLEAAGGFGLPNDIDRSFERLVRCLVAALETWAERVGPPPA